MKLKRQVEGGNSGRKVAKRRECQIAFAGGVRVAACKALTVSQQSEENSKERNAGGNLARRPFFILTMVPVLRSANRGSSDCGGNVRVAFNSIPRVSVEVAEISTTVFPGST